MLIKPIIELTCLLPLLEYVCTTTVSGQRHSQIASNERSSCGERKQNIAASSVPLCVLCGMEIHSPAIKTLDERFLSHISCPEDHFFHISCFPCPATLVHFTSLTNCRICDFPLETALHTYVSKVLVYYDSTEESSLMERYVSMVHHIMNMLPFKAITDIIWKIRSSAKMLRLLRYILFRCPCISNVDELIDEVDARINIIIEKYLHTLPLAADYKDALLRRAGLLGSDPKGGLCCTKKAQRQLSIVDAIKPIFQLFEAQGGEIEVIGLTMEDFIAYVSAFIYDQYPPEAIRKVISNTVQSIRKEQTDALLKRIKSDSKRSRASVDVCWKEDRSSPARMLFTNRHTTSSAIFSYCKHQKNSIDRHFCYLVCRDLNLRGDGIYRLFKHLHRYKHHHLVQVMLRHLRLSADMSFRFILMLSAEKYALEAITFLDYMRHYDRTKFDKVCLMIDDGFPGMTVHPLILSHLKFLNVQFVH